MRVISRYFKQEQTPTTFNFWTFFTRGIRYVDLLDPKIIYSSIFGTVNRKSPIKLAKDTLL